MHNIKCPQGYEYNRMNKNCDPIPKIRGRLKGGINPYGRFIQINSTDWRWTGGGVTPQAHIDCQDGINSFSADCTTYGESEETQWGTSSEEGMTSGLTGGPGTVNRCPECPGTAIITII